MIVCSLLMSNHGFKWYLSAMAGLLAGKYWRMSEESVAILVRFVRSESAAGCPGGARLGRAGLVTIGVAVVWSVEYSGHCGLGEKKVRRS
jgi:hypothetical protein